MVIVLRFVSPGLSVNTYLQKFNAAKNWKRKIIKINGSCLSRPQNRIIDKAIMNVIKIIPIISDKPATAWLKKPKLLIANSSVNIISLIAK